MDVMTRKYRIGVGIFGGLSCGFSLGAAMQNVGVGVAFGVAVSVAFVMISGEVSDAASARKKAISDKVPSRPLGL
jgi:hypothetical protein